MALCPLKKLLAEDTRRLLHCSSDCASAFDPDSKIFLPATLDIIFAPGNNSLGDAIPCGQPHGWPDGLGEKVCGDFFGASSCWCVARRGSSRKDGLRSKRFATRTRLQYGKSIDLVLWIDRSPR